jgi:uncharacterized protein (DUF1015 family)
LQELFVRITARPPHTDFTASDGVRHTAWVVVETPEIQFIQEQFALVPCFFIADGHHRCAAAARVYQDRRGAGHSGWFLSVLFPHDQVQILPYNRVLKDRNGRTTERLLSELKEIFVFEREGKPAAKKRHEVGFYLEDKWHGLKFRAELVATHDPVEQLDVTLLQKHVLQPIFGIDDPRTSHRINFVGGIRGASELQKLVNRGEYACAFSLFPTGIEELMAVVDSGGMMPPKSTWFEPKLRDAMFCHLI